MSFGAQGQPIEGYSQIFRNGAIESVNAELLYQPRAQDELPLHWMELLIMDCAERMLRIMDFVEIPGPYYLLLALLNVKGLRMVPGLREWEGYRGDLRTVNEPNLILPEILLENSATAIEREMRNSFDMLWNEGGWPRSFSYGEDGNFLHQDWRRALQW